ncbi:hypothetical protein AQUCO_02200260v1 [Aquilegia coerulea]|uniref:Uncharacterized protein n=1 Tax=Aquilegia coerulea TaxID=218851 RepID=A0A2G5DDW0_AQUCA|nr:hypothetical protein AQUCO_02200260v1 [Aquilegia coerulea]
MIRPHLFWKQREMKELSSLSLMPQQAEIHPQTPVQDDEGRLPTEDYNLPFIKSSHMWGSIYSYCQA